MINMTNTIKNTISISQFNRGLAGKIFDEVKNSGAKVVMKNNAAECVLLSREFDEELVKRLIQGIKVHRNMKLTIQFHSGITIEQKIDDEEWI